MKNEWVRVLSKPVAGLLLIAAMGCFIRSYRLDHRSIWLDEALSLSFASQNPSSMLRDYRDPSPPLYYLLLGQWISLFGTSEIALRSFSAILGTLAILLTGFLGKVLYDWRTALLAALFMAIMVFPIHTSQETRSYVLLLSAALGSSLFFIRSLDSPNRTNRFCYIFFTVVAAYTHYYWIFLALTQNVYVFCIYRNQKRVLFSWLVMQSIVLLCLAPWLTRFISEAEKISSGGFWISRTNSHVLFQVLRSHLAFLVHPLIPIALLLICLCGAVVDLARTKWRNGRKHDHSVYLLLWFACSILGPFLISQFFTPIFLFRYTILGVPPLYLFLARGVGRLPSVALQVLATSAIVIVCFAGIRNYHSYYQGATVRWIPHYAVYPVEPWREWFLFLKPRVEKTDLIFIAPEHAVHPFAYYNRNAMPYHVFPRAVDNKNHAAIKTSVSRLASGKKRIWLLFLKPSHSSAVSIENFLSGCYDRIPFSSNVKLTRNPVVTLYDLARPLPNPQGEFSCPGAL